MSTGAFVCVVGPSGAGKDALIGGAQHRLAGDPRFLFPRRLVTRASSAFEDHDSLSEDAFAHGVAEGRFALSWRAHGLGYALPGELLAAVDRGACAVCNVSRTIIPEARRRFGQVRVVLVTAPAEVITARLTARGRESAEAIAARRAREEAMDDVGVDLTIVNTGTVEDGAERLAAFLARQVAEAIA
ncbi:phosphonate metabolism protein/1,5-bisphosphokinase (PRPP-forming) PhnN [Labrys wisconsinensis]|uniref:Ribose 1,5-bisphosphate phosphokinase PhnN n=1 Tax=Labrys wisconsinensis TaxID=425677 RepID=A0ABU0JAB8_9HYPH|nr:phosphonate metabolism protein/1,5-bisphosphokinase (PRPP-forming) PhnN [Labrys wisconsinensis]MDQ0471199.1 ribose 1,5-bisphosphokinase [Labrys wisconsinensis]